MTAAALDAPGPVCADCRDGRHRWCNGHTWDATGTELVDCCCGCVVWEAVDNGHRSKLRWGWTT
jgi:hypothetical protein